LEVFKIGGLVIIVEKGIEEPVELPSRDLFTLIQGFEGRSQILLGNHFGCVIGTELRLEEGGELFGLVFLEFAQDLLSVKEKGARLLVSNFIEFER
jgi:hypothetical protein